MCAKAKTIEEAAVECAARLTEKDKEALRSHIGYSHHHFGYGLYLRNHYSYLLHNIDLEYPVWDGDSLSPAIYKKIIPLAFPEFRGYEPYIDRLIEFFMEDLNAAYNVKFGKNYIVDIKPDGFLTDPPYDCDWSEEEKDEWFDQRKQEEDTYYRAIAEKLWDYKAFQGKADSLGYEAAEIEEIYKKAVEMLEEHQIFMPLEVLFAKSPTKERIEAFLKALPLVEMMIERRHREEVSIFPSYLFSSRDVVLSLIKNDGFLLEYAPDFQNDDEIVKLAIKDAPGSIEFAGKRLKNDYKIAEIAAKNCKHTLMFDIKEFKKYNDDDHIVKLALKANGANISGASKRIRSDYDYAVLALKHQRTIYPDSTFKNLSKELRKMKELALLELQAPCPETEGFDKSLLDDEEIGEYIVSHRKTLWLIHNMTPRIQDMYFNRLPKWMQENVDRRRQFQ